jgi:hypothetical protein
VRSNELLNIYYIKLETCLKFVLHKIIIGNKIILFGSRAKTGFEIVAKLKM